MTSKPISYILDYDDTCGLFLAREMARHGYLVTMDEDNSLDDLLSRCNQKGMALTMATREAIDDIHYWLTKSQPVFNYLRQTCGNTSEELERGPLGFPKPSPSHESS